jgi:hypothetical protein
MHNEMTVDDAINVARVVGDLRGDDADEEVRELAVAALRLARQVEEQALELARERARRRGFGSQHPRCPEGSPLIRGADAGGRRDFLGRRPVHAGEALFLLTGAGWHPARYESNFPAREAVLYLPLPGVCEDVVIAVPRDARLAWPEELAVPGR